LIQPIDIDPIFLSRDWTLTLALTAALFFMGIGIKKQGRINRVEGAMLLGVFFAYTGYLVVTAF
jgi:cation:H+ antiporter